MSRSSKITVPLTRFCVKKHCKPERKTVTRHKSGGSTTSTFEQQHFPNCWIAQKELDMSFLSKIQGKSPFLGKVIDNILENAPQEEHNFNTFMNFHLLPLTNKRKPSLLKLERHIREISDGELTMASHVFMDNTLEMLFDKGRRTMEEIGIVMIDPQNVETYKDWARKDSFSHMIADLEAGTLYSSSKQFYEHWELVLDMMLCGFNLLEGLGTQRKLRPRYIATSFVTDDPKSTVHAMAKSSLNLNRMSPTKAQTERLLQIMKSIDRDIVTSLL